MGSQYIPAWGRYSHVNANSSKTVQNSNASIDADGNVACTTLSVANGLSVDDITCDTITVNQSTKSGSVLVASAGSTVYPTVVMSAPSTSGYTASDSGNYLNANPPYRAFDNDGNSYWLSTGTYSSTDGAYSGSSSTLVDGSPVAGEWIQLQLPLTVALTSYATTVTNVARGPSAWTLAGSSDGASWFLVDSKTGVTWSALTKSTAIAASSGYAYYRYIVQTAKGDVGSRVFITTFTLTGSPVVLGTTPTSTAISSLTVDNGITCNSLAVTGGANVGGTAACNSLTVTNGAMVGDSLAVTNNVSCATLTVTDGITADIYTNNIKSNNNSGVLIGYTPRYYPPPGKYIPTTSPSAPGTITGATYGNGIYQAWKVGAHLGQAAVFSFWGTTASQAGVNELFGGTWGNDGFPDLTFGAANYYHDWGTTVGGTTYYGGAVQMRTPHRMRGLAIRMKMGTYTPRKVRAFVVLGGVSSQKSYYGATSELGITWTLLGSYSGLTWTTGVSQTFNFTSGVTRCNVYRVIITEAESVSGTPGSVGFSCDIWAEGNVVSFDGDDVVNHHCNQTNIWGAMSVGPPPFRDDDQVALAVDGNATITKDLAITGDASVAKVTATGLKVATPTSGRQVELYGTAANMAAVEVYMENIYDFTFPYTQCQSAIGQGYNTRGAYWWVAGADRININTAVTDTSKLGYVGISVGGTALFPLHVGNTSQYTCPQNMQAAPSNAFPTSYSSGTVLSVSIYGKGYMLSDSGMLAPSDGRLKNVISPVLDDHVQLLEKLKPVWFKWKNPERGDGAKCGFVAQELEEMFPQFVYMLPGEIDGKHVDDLRTVDHNPLIAMLVAAHQQTSNRIRELEKLPSRIAELEKICADLSAKVASKPHLFK